MDRFARFLQEKKESSTLRRLAPVVQKKDATVTLGSPGTTPHLDFSSNDYLGLSRHPQVIQAAEEALERFGAGAGAARLMSGDLVLHHELEERLARVKETEAALLFGSGYLANIGVIPALVGRKDAIFADRLVHASIIDGCRLSGARVYRYRHNDCDHLTSLLTKKRSLHANALLITESVFSMDGDMAPLAELVRLKEQHGCLLMVDEAHAFGVFGQKGGGLLEETGCAHSVDIAMATLGKALGSYGAFVAVTGQMKEYLINRARSFIFSTGLPPASAAAAAAALDHVAADSIPRKRLLANSRFLKEQLKKLGVAGHQSPSQIIPVPVGASEAALSLALCLREQGIFATAVRPPTVPDNTARLRLSVTSLFGADDLYRAAQEISIQLRRMEV